MAINDTTTHASTVRDAYNTGILGKESDASQKAPLGDILAVLLDVANTAVTVSAVTVGTSVTPTLTPTATGALVPTATSAVVISATAVSAATAVTPASAAYASPDQTILANLGNANKVAINACVTDITNLIAKVNAATVDIIAIAPRSAPILIVLAMTTRITAP